jgi:Ca2+-binding EF-hand superfamily protein
MKMKLTILPIIAALCALANPAIGQNAQNQKDNMRFQGLDRNRDGRITRNEWRGNNQSFSNEDWNGDGVLSGDEVTPGARRPGDFLSSERTASRFRDLDRNQDGVLSRGEWRGDRMAFNRLDSDRDGSLDRDEFFLNSDDQARRFADLDRNHDGVIARNEWNDDRQSFDALDANRDNLLGRDEFSSMASNGNNSTFAELDRDHNGVIARNEWNNDRQSFDALDTNRDNLLGRYEFPGRTFSDRFTSFSELDANHDGRITRNEWVEDLRTFDSLDTNRNAVLTREEYSLRAANNRVPGFSDLDANRDGRIAASEWRRSAREFDYIDANRDGVLSRDEFQRQVNAGPSTQARAVPMIISSGSEFSIRTNETIDSKVATVGQLFSAMIERDILDNSGKLAIPKGSDAKLAIRQAADGTGNDSELVLDVDSVTVAGIRYMVSTQDLQEKGRDGIGANRRTGVMVGGGAGLGALIGAITGGGKGAAIGAGVGAAAGAAGQVLTKGRQVKVPAESVLTFKLERDLHVQPVS